MSDIIKRIIQYAADLKDKASPASSQKDLQNKYNKDKLSLSDLEKVSQYRINKNLKEAAALSGEISPLEFVDGSNFTPQEILQMEIKRLTKDNPVTADRNQKFKFDPSKLSPADEKEFYNRKLQILKLKGNN